MGIVGYKSDMATGMMGIVGYKSDMATGMNGKLMCNYVVVIDQ